MKYGKEKLSQMSKENLKHCKNIPKKSYNRLKKGIEYHREFQQKIYTNKNSNPLKIIIAFLGVISLVTLPIHLAMLLIICGILLYIVHKPFIEEQEPKFLPSFEGEVAYVDNNSSSYEGNLSSFKNRICGKPDNIQKLNDGTYYVIELKNKEKNETGKPYFNDKMQLACYFILTEEHFGPCHVGLIKYKNCQFQIENTPELKEKLLKTVKYMQYLIKSNTPPKKPKYISRKKCSSCKCKYTVCELYNYNNRDKLSNTDY